MSGKKFEIGDVVRVKDKIHSYKFCTCKISCCGRIGRIIEIIVKIRDVDCDYRVYFGKDGFPICEFYEHDLESLFDPVEWHPPEIYLEDEFFK